MLSKPKIRSRILLILLAYGLSALLMIVIHLLVSPANHGRLIELTEDVIFVVLSCVIIYIVASVSFRSLRRSQYAQELTEERLRCLLGSIDDLVLTIDRELGVTGAFGNWIRDAGFDSEVFAGRRLREIFGERFLDDHGQSLHEVLQGGSRVESWETKISGQRVLFETSLTPLRNPVGIIIGIAAVLRDVTAQQEGEQTLRLYELLVEHTGEMVLFIDSNDNLIELNRAVAETLGFDRDVLRAMPLRVITDSPSAIEAIDRARHSGSSVTVDCRFRRRDGRSIPVEMSAVSGVIGARTIVMAVARDLSSRQDRERFRHLVHQINRRLLHRDHLPTILRFISEQLVDAYGFPLIQVSLKGPDGSVRVQEYAGEASDFIQDLNLRWDETPYGLGPTGTAIRTGTAQACDVTSDPGFEPWRERAVAFGLSHALAIPIVSESQVLGALTLFARQGEAFDESDVEEITSFADEVSLSLLAAEGQERINLQTVALEAAANAVVITDEHGQIEWVNPAFARLTGYSADEARGKTPAILRSGRHPSSFYAQMWKILLEGQTWRGEIYNRRKDGEIYLEDQTITPVRRADGSISHFVAIKQDITSHRRQEERIAHLATHDGLTNLPNRHPLERTLRRCVMRTKDDSRAALLILGLDNFSAINESYGHFVGDQVLTDLVGVLHSQLRPEDFLARPGGDEFAIVLQSASLSEAREIAERLRRTVEEHRFPVDHHHIRLTISAGLTQVVGNVDAEALLIQADSALYLAKGRGKNRVVTYSDGASESQLAEGGRWYSELLAALEEERFILHFQPVISLSDGSARHYEALVRLTGREGELVFPDRFIPAAERFGLMPKIDLFVVGRTIEVLSRDDTLRIFVNLSASTLNHDDVLAEIAEMIRNSDISPGSLAFEITETVALNDLIRAQSWISTLQKLGCAFALDDFGVGFSSFSSLRALSVDFVKVDRSFVRDIDTNPTNRALVEAVRAVAHTLGKEVIAEGVETLAHADVLAGLGVEYGQGYLWGQPDAGMAFLRDDLCQSPGVPS